MVLPADVDITVIGENELVEYLSLAKGERRSARGELQIARDQVDQKREAIDALTTEIQALEAECTRRWEANGAAAFLRSVTGE